MEALLSAAASASGEQQVAELGVETAAPAPTVQQLQKQLHQEAQHRKRMQLGLDQLKARLAHGIRYTGKVGSSSRLVKRERASAKRRIQQLGCIGDEETLEQVLNCVYATPSEVDVVREAQETGELEELDDGAPSGAKLVVVTGVPPKIIYHRLIKPFPVVKLVGAEAHSDRGVLVTLDVVRANSPATVVTALPQTYMVPLDSSTKCAEFRKLKLNVTSASVNSAFRLRFSLKQFPKVQGLSEPFYVYSHTSYLTTEKKKAKTK